MPHDAISAVVDIAADYHGVFTRIEAAASGLTAHLIATALRRGWLTEPVPGVLVIAGSPDTWRRRLAVLVAAGKGRAAGSARSAGVLHRLDPFDDPDALGKPTIKLPPNVRTLGPVKPPVPLEATVAQPYWYAPPAGYDAHVHQARELDELDVITIDHIRCTGLARTLVDLGAVCTDEEVWQALISARRLHDVSPVWLTTTATRLDRPGPSGVKTIRRLLRRWAAEGVLPESFFEDLMLAMLADPAHPEVVRQHTIRDASGAFVARVDAAIPAARVAFEAHSRRFHFGPIREAADEDRDLKITGAGYEVIYLSWYATKTPAAVLAQVRPIVLDRLARYAATG
jgi:hypothetical protein